MIITKAREFKNDIEILSFYKKHGWVSIKSNISKEKILKIKDELNKFFKLHVGYNLDKSIIHLNKSNKKKLYLLHLISSKITTFKEFFNTFSEISNIVNRKKSPVYEIASGYMLGVPKDKRLTYDFHQESNYMKDYKDILNVHYPLFCKSTLKNGTMSALDKSHKLGRLNYNKKRLSKDSYTDLIPNKIDELKKNYRELHFELNIGDVLYFHKDLIHKSNFNNTMKCRPVGIARLTQNYAGGKFNNLRPEDL